jgi:hypothetical protein
MRLLISVLGPLRVLGATAALGCACDLAGAEPVPDAGARPVQAVAAPQPPTVEAANAMRSTSATPVATVTAASHANVATPVPPLVTRGRLRPRATIPLATTVAAPSAVATAVVRDSSTSFEPCESPRPVAGTPRERGPVAPPPHACGPCGRG